MNDEQVKQQIQQMVSFIKQEADDKANEIRTKAEEDFNIRKLNAVNEARVKISSEYAKKTKAIEVNRKIAQSTEQNAARLQVLKARDGMLNDVYTTAVVKLADLADNSPSEYATLISDMILQGLIKLDDETVAVRCRKADKEIVSDAIGPVSESYIAKTGKPLTLTLDEEAFLADGCAGGVSLLSEGGRIIVENTFESRLAVAYQQNLPLIRSVLFEEK